MKFGGAGMHRLRIGISFLFLGLGLGHAAAQELPPAITYAPGAAPPAKYSPLAPYLTLAQATGGEKKKDKEPAPVDLSFLNPPAAPPVAPTLNPPMIGDFPGGYSQSLITVRTVFTVH